MHNHPITSLAGSGVPQMLSSGRAPASHSAKPTKPFQPIDINTNTTIAQPQTQQAVTSVDSSPTTESLDPNSMLRRFGAQGDKSALTPALSQGMTGFKNALGQSGYLRGEPSIASAKRIQTASPSLDNLDGSGGTDDDPGTIVNVLA